MIRKPIISILGHVDHGKTKLLDTIRRTTVVDREAGAITQAIGASIVPSETILRLCGKLLKALGVELTIPGLLFIDTPGHAAFSNLRKRGGNLADLAILIVDINEGFKPQTLEAIEILKKSKTPFIVAANKIDLVSGWQQNKCPILESLSKQSPTTIELLEKKMYELVGAFHEQGLESERFDRVEDHSKQLALVPICAKSGEGVPELLMVLTGLVQKFLKEKLVTEVKGAGVGTILEVKEEQGLGKTLDIILYNGSIKVKDTIVIGGIDKPIVTTIKALLEPAALGELRDKKTKFRGVKEVHAAIGVKVSAKEIDEVIAGMPVRVANNETLEQIKEDIQKEVEEVLIETDDDGIIIKADALGSLEAMTTILREKGVKIRKASIGNITKKDINEAEANYEKDPFQGVILGFNVNVNKDVEGYLNDSSVTVLTNSIIYRLVEDFEVWIEAEKKKLVEKEIDKLIRPCKMQFMANHTFRQSNPAVVGMDIIVGKLKTGTQLLKENGEIVTSVKSMQLEKESVSEVEAPKQLSISLTNVTVGRQINENDYFYSAIPEEDFRKLKKYKKFLSKAEIEVIKEIVAIMRENNPVWGV